MPLLELLTEPQKSNHPEILEVVDHEGPAEGPGGVHGAPEADDGGHVGDADSGGGHQTVRPVLSHL